jgi:hypothetical protein
VRTRNLYNLDSASLPETLEISGYTSNGTAISRIATLDHDSAGQVIEMDGPRTDVSDVTERRMRTAKVRH